MPRVAGREMVTGGRGGGEPRRGKADNPLVWNKGGKQLLRKDICKRSKVTP